MNNLIYQLKTWLIFAIHSLAISAVFCAIKWLVSLTSLCGAPTWIDFLAGAAGIFVLYNLIGLYGVIKFHKNKGLDRNNKEQEEKVMYLYDTLHKDGSYIGTATQFRKMFYKDGDEGAEARRHIWEAMYDGGHYLKPYKEFCNWLGIKP